MRHFEKLNFWGVWWGSNDLQMIWNFLSDVFMTFCAWEKMSELKIQKNVRQPNPPPFGTQTINLNRRIHFISIWISIFELTIILRNTREIYFFSLFLRSLIRSFVMKNMRTWFFRRLQLQRCRLLRPWYWNQSSRFLMEGMSTTLRERTQMFRLVKCRNGLLFEEFW